MEEETTRDIAGQARDMVRGLFFGLVDTGVVNAEQAWRIFNDVTYPLPKEEVEELRREIGRAIEAYERRG